MTVNIFVKPAFSAEFERHLKVRDPQSGDELPIAGAWKQNSDHWRRLIRDGDVIDDTKNAHKQERTAKAGK